MSRFITQLFGVVFFSAFLLGAAPPVVTEDAPSSPAQKEMMEFVKKAVAYIRANGKDAAFVKFNNKSDKEFHIGELYIYAYDYKGSCLAHGQRPTLIGKEGFNVKSPDGDYPSRRLAELASKKKKGFLEYKWSNPLHNRVERKVGYVEDVDGEYFIGSGVYPPELNP